ncbi:hypothetical protein [Bergeriella denitrificans]|uniref:Periplasmic protein n=1 Tax=Bergeriella denitrificans TaxID=494 RepID=A0A378UJ47_BERDE|nr:hypothetical protein [Bergeriella denitrificans]STZ77160.1 Periplasmic protein [Bergeriella denitrificans]
MKKPSVRRWLKTAALLLALFASFRAGMAFEAYIYEEICLDSGGGKNPGGFPICVIDEETRKQGYHRL